MCEPTEHCSTPPRAAPPLRLSLGRLRGQGLPLYADAQRARHRDVAVRLERKRLLQRARVQRNSPGGGQ